MSEILTIFLSNLGGTAVGVLVLGFLFKTWISARLTEGIKAEYGEILETLKTRLANDAKIHEKRVHALEALHAILLELMPTRESEDQEWEDAMMVVGFDVGKPQEPSCRCRLDWRTAILANLGLLRHLPPSSS